MTNNPADVKKYFMKINRLLTSSLVSILIIISVVFWYTETVTVENSSFWIGAAFMLLALIFYQLPYVSFLVTRHHYAGQDWSGIEILGSGWRTFRQWLESS